MMGYLVVGSTVGWETNIGLFILSLVAIGGGIYLIISAIGGISKALGGGSQEWGKALALGAVGLIGGLFAVWGASSIWGFFKNHGQEIPHS